MSQKVRVYILSDNRLFRESLARILAKKNDIDVVATQQLSCGSAEDVLNSGAQILLLDSASFLFSQAAMLRPNRNGGMVAPKLLLVAIEEDEKMFLRAVRTGASGFIAKEASAMDIVTAVRSVAQGEAVCSPRLCRFLFDCLARQKFKIPENGTEKSSALTRREQQLIPLIGRGLTNKEIAAQLNLSEQTIKNHVHRILHKVGVENRARVMRAYETQERGEFPHYSN